MSDQDLLATALSSAVPLWIEQLRSRDWAYIEQRAKVCSQEIAEHGDNILYRSRKKGETATAFNRLAEGVACLAFAPGGVTIFGQHFDAKGGVPVKLTMEEAAKSLELGPLTANELAALRKFAAFEGRCWKHNLWKRWSREDPNIPWDVETAMDKLGKRGLGRLRIKP